MPRKNFTHFEISERKILLRVFDVVWVLFSLSVVGIVLDFKYFSFNSEFWEWALILAVYLCVFATVFELYDLQKASKFYTVFKNVVFTVSITVLFFLLTPYFTPELPNNRLQIVYFFLAILTAMLIWRFAYIVLISTPRFYKRVLIMGNPENMAHIAAQLREADPHYNIIGCVHSGKNHNGEPAGQTGIKLAEFANCNLNNLLRENSIDELLISNLSLNGNKEIIHEELLELLRDGFPVKDYNQVYEEKTYRIPVEHLEEDFYKFFPFSRNHQNKFYLFFQRVADIFVSLFGIVIGALLIPFILVANYFGNRGKLFYKQKRVGKNGKVFEILKFRTMKHDAETNGAQWAQKNDVRITRFGKFMRRSRMDEFPQFYNILKGDMSLIGPRPERPCFVEELSKMIHFYDTRHVIKPGLTGWAQVMTEYGNSHAGSMEKLQYDLYYIKHRNFFLDITVLIKTLSTIVFYRGQ
ncbi:MAG TPA: sugar transferase [Salinimicrobium sp.]|nr:sugar transferase [Salinimicrobium sp.]